MIFSNEKSVMVASGVSEQEITVARKMSLVSSIFVFEKNIVIILCTCVVNLTSKTVGIGELLFNYHGSLVVVFI